MQKKLTGEVKKEEKLKPLEKCPFCGGGLVKKGIRKKKYESVQIYYCRMCNKKITPLIAKNKTFPLKIIFDSLSLYNRLTPLNKIPGIIKETYGVNVSIRTISGWIEEYKSYTPFLRMREFAEKKYRSQNMIEEAKLIHKQIYDFKFHSAKLEFILSENFSYHKFAPLKSFLNLVISECPHQVFTKENERASEIKDIFNLDEVKIIPKQNSAVKIARLALQAVSNNKQRHSFLQEFMLTNDSVTIAIEIPVLLNSDDIRHYKHELGFKVPLDIPEGEYFTGHIDMIQLRNGMIHILDFKPGASRKKPISQLTCYALALSRLTGIRIYHFKCAWFDDKDYYEFFPLHVVYKLNKKRKRLPRDQKRL